MVDHSVRGTSRGQGTLFVMKAVVLYTVVHIAEHRDENAALLAQILMWWLFQGDFLNDLYREKVVHEVRRFHIWNDVLLKAHGSRPCSSLWARMRSRKS